MGERLFYTQKVAGSIPATPTKHGEAVQVASSTDCKSAGYTCAGSTPALPTKKNAELSWHLFLAIVK